MFAPDDIEQFREQEFRLCYVQRVCQLRREVTYERPVRLTGREWILSKRDGRKQHRLVLFFDFGPDSVGWGVDIADIVKLVPYVGEVA